MRTPSRFQPDLPKWTDTDFRSLVDAAPDAMMVVNQAWEVVVANTQAEKLFGYSREQLIGKSVESLISPKFRELHAQDRGNFFSDARVQPSGTWLELFALRHDGAEIPVEINLSPLTTEAGTFVISAIRDATDLRRVEELKKSEAVLRETRESEERFRLMADFAPVLIWMSGPDKLCTYFNKRWLDFTGRSLDQERGNGWAEGVHPDDLQRCLDTYTLAFERREEFRMEYRLRRHDGEYRWIFDDGVPRFNQDGSFAGYVGSAVDVTERKLVDIAVRESEERFRLAAQAGKMFAYDWDTVTDAVAGSGECAQILGIDEATPTTGQELMALVHPGDRERLAVAIAKLSPEKPNIQISYRRVRPDGAVIWVERIGRAHFNEQGRMVRMVGMTTDITERMLTERELALANDRLRMAMESGKSLAWDWDIKSGTNSWFGDLRSILGMPADGYVGRIEDFHSRVHADDRERVLEAVKDAKESKKTFEAEFRILWPDGTLRWVAARGKFHYSPNGEPERMLGIKVDITERKLMEVALRESEERLRLAAHVGKMYAFDWDVATDVIIRSAEAAHLPGMTGQPISFTKQELLASVHPDDRAKFIASNAERTPESPDTQIAYRLLRPDGSVLWLEKTGHAFFDERGKMVRMVGMVADITDRKLAESELALANDRLRLAMESGKSVGWDRDVKSGRDILFGDLKSIFGIPSETFVGHVEDFHRFVHPEDRGRVVKAIDDAMQGRKPYEAEFRILWPDGTVRWVAGKGKFYYSSDGEPERMLGNSVDITERKLMEVALRESEERFRLAAQAGRMYAFDWDAATDVVIRSDESTHILGLNNGETRLTLQQMLASVHPEDRATFMSSLAELTPESPITRISFRFVRPDGSVLWLERSGHAFFDERGKMLRMVGMVADITERKLTEETLRQKEMELLEAQRLAQVGSWKWDPQTDTVTWSRELYRIAGRDPNLPAVSYKDHSQLYTAESWERLQRAVEEALRNGTPYELDIEMVHPDGPTKWIRARGEVQRDNTGRIVGLRGTAQDVTERKLAETELTVANDRLRLAMESGKSVGWDWDIKNGRDSWFGDLQSIFGLPVENCVGPVENFHRYLHPEDRGRVLEPAMIAMEGKKPYAAEFRILWPDGTVRWLTAKGEFYYSPNGAPERMLGMAVDITERKLMEVALRESEERLRLAAQAGKMYAFDWNAATGIVMRSEKASQILGFASEQIGSSHEQFLASVHPEDRAIFIASNTERTPASPNTQINFRLLRPDGSVLWLEKTAHAFFDEQGRMVRMIGMVADVTARKLGRGPFTNWWQVD
jgi:PAS domain S-box-containing protein